jgi:uncharacterized protein HemX
MNKKSSTGKIAAGLGLAAMAATAAAIAAGYYFSGKQGKKHRKEFAGWSAKAKADMLIKIKKMEAFSKQAYNKAAEEVLAKYKQAKNIDPKELQTLGRELKGHWEKIAKEVSKLGTKNPSKKTAPSRKKSAR